MNDALADVHAELNADDALGAGPTSAGFEPEKLGMLTEGACGSVTEAAVGVGPENGLG